MSEESNLIDQLNYLTSNLDEMMNDSKTDIKNKMERLGPLCEEMGILLKKNNQSVVSLIDQMEYSDAANESELIERFQQFNKHEQLIGVKLIEIIYKYSSLRKNLDKKAEFWYDKLKVFLNKNNIIV